MGIFFPSEVWVALVCSDHIFFYSTLDISPPHPTPPSPPPPGHFSPPTPEYTHLRTSILGLFSLLKYGCLPSVLITFFSTVHWTFLPPPHTHPMPPPPHPRTFLNPQPRIYSFEDFNIGVIFPSEVWVPPVCSDHIFFYGTQNISPPLPTHPTPTPQDISHPHPKIYSLEDFNIGVIFPSEVWVTPVCSDHIFFYSTLDISPPSPTPPTPGHFSPPPPTPPEYTHLRTSILRLFSPLKYG